ncbi:hypothetical protein V865_001259 [Kwoniella europaea PYCC6329]|uniref:U1 small nuclear ribonucleoprotein C n=1 Tax=Kwoniella europaea PYCC6329 TaxID=1423913 RepID=A0AAX4KB98_9TREE
MGKYYCDYCDIYLTHDSMNARKAHNTGRNHVANVRDYFAGLNHDKAQNIIDQIISQHESGGGRQQMMMAPSMRLGAGFLNPMTTQQGYPPSSPSQSPFPPSTGAPPFRPPFPPNGNMPPFAPSAGSGTPPPFRPPPTGIGAGAPPFPPTGVNGYGGPPPTNGMPFRPPPASNSPNGFASPPGAGAAAAAAPPSFTQASQPPAGAAPGIHPDRLRMMGSR